jgi:hypothetical protein
MYFARGVNTYIYAEIGTQISMHSIPYQLDVCLLLSYTGSCILINKIIISGILWLITCNNIMEVMIKLMEVAYAATAL